MTARIHPEQRYAWRGPSLLVTTPRGECDADGLSGYYYREARHLRVLRLLVNGVRPWPCSQGSSGHDELSFVYVYPELTDFGGGGTDVSDDTTPTDEHGISQRAIDIRILHRVEPNGFTTTVQLANRSHERAQLDLAWDLEADFADIQEAFAGERQQRAPVETIEEWDGLRFRYAHDQLPLETLVRATGAEWRVRDGSLVATIAIDPRETLTIVLVVRPVDHVQSLSDAESTERLARLAQWADDLATIETPNDSIVGEIARQALTDLGSLALLEGEADEWLAVQAGIPLYPALFGRDAITAGWQAAMFDRGQLLDAALTRLGRLQSNRTNDWRDEEPGRIPFQIRTGPLARLGVSPLSAYYADFASPLMFVISLAHHFAWTNDRTFLQRHWDVARRILDWAREHGDSDADGYLEYETKSSKGTKNQGWKDSGNAILYEDGRPVSAPLATCELQGYWFAAQQLMSGLSWALDMKEDAKAYWHSASDLKSRFNRDWWMEDKGFVALAMDADKRLATSITSNAGHCLATGIVADEYIPRVVERLFAPDMFSGWGIRTLSTGHPSYNPLSYHRGSVWPVENATIIFGLRRFGFDEQALDLAEAFFDLAHLHERGRSPECVGGYSRAEFPHPGAYPRANPLQAWNQSAVALVMQSILGMQPVAALDLLVVDPVLPPWLPELTLRGLRVGGATATIRFVRGSHGKSHAEIVDKRGTLHMVHQPPPESLTAGTRDRVASLLRSIVHH